MGYNYSADFTLHVSEASQVAMALDLPRLHEQSSRSSTDVIPLFDSTNLLDEIFTFLDFEVDISETETIYAQGSPISVTTFQGWVNTKLRPTLDTLIVWLASCGVGIHMNCRGEDDEMWQYKSETGSGVLANRTLTTITQHDLDQLKVAEKTLKTILASVDANQFVDPYVVMGALDNYRTATARR